MTAPPPLALSSYAGRSGVARLSWPYAALRLVRFMELAITWRVNPNRTAAPAPRAAAPDDAILRNLIARMAQAEDAALAEFYDATAARVFALAKRIVREPRTAEEIVSDVYLQAWQQAQRYDPARGHVLAWLLTICRSRALDRLRQRDPAEPHPAPDSLRPDLYRDDADPLELVAAFEHGSRVRAALAGLGEKEQRLLLLAFFQGLSHREIAAHTRMPLGSVKTILRRAVETLRVRLADTATEEAT